LPLPDLSILIVSSKRKSRKIKEAHVNGEDREVRERKRSPARAEVEGALAASCEALPSILCFPSEFYVSSFVGDLRNSLASLLSTPLLEGSLVDSVGLGGLILFCPTATFYLLTFLFD